MDLNEYRKHGKELVDYIADYLENIRDRRVFPDVKPGYMRSLVPESAPIEGEDWNTIFNDVEGVIMPGITHWQSPHMHAYFPALNSGPSLLGDMLADAINCLGFTWASSPACTELETIVMNWLGKMIGLPDSFLHLTSASQGGGVIQTTASEATLVCLLAGRTQAIRRFHEHTPNLSDAEINARLVAYCSDQAHSSVEKAALIGLVQMRYIESDENLSLRGAALQEAIEDDIKLGLIPFWVCATLGTTGGCSFDNLEEVGNVCTEYKLWLHVDAAYAGSAFICPEFRRWLKGIDKADSIAFNPSKWLMVHFDCTAMWVKNSGALHRTFNVEPLYLQHENSGLAIDYMHWQIPLSKRFRALKLWFVIRNYGIKGLQKHIREGVRLAQKFEALVLADQRFEIPAIRHLGEIFLFLQRTHDLRMVVFRIKGENDLTERLLKRLNHGGKLHCVPSSLKGKYVIRFTITSPKTTNDDIIKDWSEIRLVATNILKEMNVKIGDRAKVPLKDTRAKNEAFGSSLLLANSPMSPKIVNGSFAAIFDTEEFFTKVFAGVRGHNSPAMRRRVRGILMSGKQFSLDSRMDLVFHGMDAGGGNNHKENSSEQDGEKPRAITEDGEDTWEVCENHMENQFVENVLRHATILHKHNRPFSMDAALLDHIRFMSPLTNDNEIYSIFQPFIVSSQCESTMNNSSPPITPHEDVLFSPRSLSTIIEQTSLDLSLLECPRYEMKRKSEPILKKVFCSKYNSEIAPIIINPQRRYSLYDFSRNPLPHISEFVCEELSLDDDSFVTSLENIPEKSKSPIGIFPKIKLRVTDEDGYCVPCSFDSDSDISDLSLTKFFDDFFNNSDTIQDVDFGTEDAFLLTDGNPYLNKICQKCGHCKRRKQLQLQFSTSYE